MKIELSAEATRNRIIAARGKPVTRLGFTGYNSALAIPVRDPDFWRGKSILDLGLGAAEGSDGDSKAFFPGAEACAVDPEFSLGRGDREYRIQLYYPPFPYEMRPGVAQEIPYDDDRFDFVFSRNAVPQHVPPEEIPLAIAESIRVTKPEGEIRFHDPIVQKRLSSVEPHLKAAGFGVDYLNRQCVQIRCDPNFVGEKTKRWRDFCEAIVPEEPIREEI